MTDPPRRFDDVDAYRSQDIYAFTESYIDATLERMPQIDRDAMHLVLLLGRVSRMIFHDLEATAQRPHGLSPAGFYVAAIVWLGGPLESNRVATISGMSRAGVSSLTRTLAKDGWIEQNRSPDDGRAVLLSITPRGEAAMTEVFGAVNEREKFWAGALDREEVRMLTRLLARLVDR